MTEQLGNPKPCQGSLSESDILSLKFYRAHHMQKKQISWRTAKKALILKVQKSLWNPNTRVLK